MISFCTVTNQNLKIETIQYETVGFGAVIIWVEKNLCFSRGRTELGCGWSSLSKNKKAPLILYTGCLLTWRRFAMLKIKH